MKLFVTGIVEKNEKFDYSISKEIIERLENNFSEIILIDEKYKNVRNYNKFNFFQKRLKILLECNCIFMIDTWWLSRYAKFELEVAIKCNYKIYCDSEISKNIIQKRLKILMSKASIHLIKLEV